MRKLAKVTGLAHVNAKLELRPKIIMFFDQYPTLPLSGILYLLSKKRRGLFSSGGVDQKPPGVLNIVCLFQFNSTNFQSQALG